MATPSGIVSFASRPVLQSRVSLLCQSTISRLSLDRDTISRRQCETDPALPARPLIALAACCCRVCNVFVTLIASAACCCRGCNCAVVLRVDLRCIAASWESAIGGVLVRVLVWRAGEVCAVVWCVPVLVLCVCAKV